MFKLLLEWTDTHVLIKYYWLRNIFDAIWYFPIFMYNKHWLYVDSNAKRSMLSICSSRINFNDHERISLINDYSIRIVDLNRLLSIFICGYPIFIEKICKCVHRTLKNRNYFVQNHLNYLQWSQLILDVNYSMLTIIRNSNRPYKKCTEITHA